MLQSLDHIDIVCIDLDGWEAFAEPLGLVRIKETSNHSTKTAAASRTREYCGGTPAPKVEVHEARFFELVGFNHLAFGVQDARRGAEWLSAQGVRIDNVRDNPDNGKTLVNFRTPDGVRLQLAEHDPAPPDRVRAGGSAIAGVALTVSSLSQHRRFLETLGLRFDETDGQLQTRLDGVSLRFREASSTGPVGLEQIELKSGQGRVRCPTGIRWGQAATGT